MKITMTLSTKDTKNFHVYNSPEIPALYVPKSLQPNAEKPAASIEVSIEFK